jgi:aminoglycoside phosphotransferase (APT) family kinase protein
MDASFSVTMTKLLQSLSQHKPFTEKEGLALTPLTQQGHCNQSFLLHNGTERYALRQFGEEKRDRALEYRIQTLAYEQGIAPKPHLLDIQNSFMVSAYIEGTHRKHLNHEALQILADTLRTLHSIKIDTPPIRLTIEHSSLDVFHPDPVLCHNDLNPHNLIWHHTLTLIDWEYAGSNDRYFDLASVVVEFGLESADREVFMETYFQHHTWNKEKLEAYTHTYREVCEQWWKQR